MRYPFLLCWFVLVVLQYPTWGQARLNLDFEPTVNGSQPLVLWFHYRNPDCAIDLDTVGAQQGLASVRFTIAKEAEKAYSHLGNLSFPVDSARGKLLSISGYVRTTNFRGKAGLYAYVSAPEATEHLAIVDKLDSLPRTSSWRRLEIQVPVGLAATSIALGFKLQGTGQVWLDHMQIRLAQHVYQDAPLAGTEPLLYQRTTPADWSFDSFLPLPTSISSASYQASLDPVAPYAGPSSLRLDIAAAKTVAFPFLGSLRLDSTLGGKKLTIKGYIRQAAPSPIAPAFYYADLLRDNRQRLLTASRQYLRTIPLPAATTTWQPFEVSLVVPTLAGNGDKRVEQELSFGLAVAAPTTLWLDELRFTLNNQPFTPRNPVVLPAPTAAELAWLRQASHPLLSIAPTASISDLSGLGTLVGSSNVVGLGGVTYGSQEVQLLQQRLFRYLVEQKGFAGLVLEADMAACYRLNQYLLTGRGDLSQLLAALGPWNTQPMLTLVQWLRLRNQRGGSQVQLAGATVADPHGVFVHLRQTTAPQDERTLAQLTEAEKLLAELTAKHLQDNPYAATYRKPALLQQLHALLEDMRTSARRYQGTTLTQLAWRDQWVRLLEQYSTWCTLGVEVADEYLLASQAENVSWLAHHLPSQKMVVVGHNTFIGNTTGIGRWLKESAGTGYVALGMTFHTGSFTAYAEGIAQTASVQPSYPGTYEAYFQAAKLPLAFLDLRQLTLQAATNSWLFQRLLLRDSKLKATANSFNRYDVRREFEGLLFMATSSPVVRVPKNK